MGFRIPRCWPAASLWVGAVAMALATGAGAQSDRAALDQPVREFKLKDLLSGKEVALSQFKGKPVVLSFISYRCDTSWRYEKRMGKMIGDYRGKDVVFLNVNSNANDTPEGITKYVQARNLTVPLLKDTGNRVADYFGARVTPTFYVIDKEGVLRYRGSFDNHPSESQASQQFVLPAVNAVLASKPVPVKENRAFG